MLQSEASECGLVSLAIASGLLGGHLELSELRRKFTVSTRGLTVKNLVDISAAIGIAGRAVKCEVGELEDLACPAILHWGGNHFVVLEKITMNGAIVHDPAKGKIRPTFKEISKKFSGIAIELAATTEFQRRKKKSPMNLTEWFRFPRALWGSLLQIALLSFFLQLYVVVSPFFMQLAIDQVAVKGDKKLLTALALGFGLFALFNSFATLIRGFVTVRLTAVLNWDMTNRLFRQLIRLPLPWFQRRKLADVLSRFESIAPIRNLVSGSLVSSLVDGVLAFVTLIMMVIFSGQLTIVVVCAFAVFVFLRLVFLRSNIQAGMEFLAASIAENGKRIETIRAIQTIKVMGAENAREADWANKYAEMLKREFNKNRLGVYETSFRGLIEVSLNLLLIYVGVQFVIEGEITIGILYAFVAYATQFYTRAAGLFDQFISWRMTDMYSNRLADIVLTAKESGIDDVIFGPGEIVGKIELKNVSFSYAHHEKDVFQNISFCIEPGEYVAIIGPSGVGKSTLLKVMCGLYQANYGEITYDNRSIESWGLKNIRSVIGVVLQDDELLTGTILQNVSFFDENVDQDWVWECLRLSSIDEDVAQMPMRLDTYLGDMGSNLSGGQKQRLLLARALYKRPKILILDEATSHLDPGRESKINSAMKALSMTRIIVAHRQETIASAERIIALGYSGIAFDSKEIQTLDT